MSIWWLIGISIGAALLLIIAFILGLCRVAANADALSEDWYERMWQNNS